MHRNLRQFAVLLYITTTRILTTSSLDDIVYDKPDDLIKFVSSSSSPPPPPPPIHVTEKRTFENFKNIIKNDDDEEVNRIADSLLSMVNEEMRRTGKNSIRLEHAYLPNDGSGRNIVEIRVENGTFNNINTLYRTGNGSSDYRNDTFFLTIPLGLKKSYIRYGSYKIKTFKWTLSEGYLTADILENSATLKISVDLVECTVELKDLKLNYLPKWKLSFSRASSLTNWFLNKLAEILLSHYKQRITPVLERHVYRITKEYLKDIDICALALEPE